MARVKHLNGALGQLGKVVELRELTVGQWLELQKSGAADNEQEQSLRMLALSLYVDGKPIGWEALMGLGMSVVTPALSAMTELMSS